MSGRERHLLVDTQGFPLKVVVSAADAQDRDGGRLVAEALRLYGPEMPRPARIWADAAYAGAFVEGARERFGWTVEIVKRSDAQKERPGFQVQPRRRVVERAFGWWGGFRRPSKDYEYELESSEALLHAAMSHLLLRRLTRRTPSACGPAG